MKKHLLFALLILFLNYQLEYHLDNHAFAYSSSLPIYTNTTFYPEKIYIAKLHLFLPVTFSPIQKGEWLLTEEKTAFYGEGTASLGEEGTTVIFAHARNGLFSKLPLIKTGNAIGVISRNTLFLYTITNKKLILPHEVDFIRLSGNNQLALFTCYGFNDLHRIVFFADLVKKIDMKDLDNNLYQI